jgi:hypothetical protein
MVELGKKEAPKLLPSNPGITVAGKVDFSNAQRAWIEHFNRPSHGIGIEGAGVSGRE